VAHSSPAKDTTLKAIDKKACKYGFKLDEKQKQRQVVTVLVNS
jgi:hypothetical protein